MRLIPKRLSDYYAKLQAQYKDFEFLLAYVIKDIKLYLRQAWTFAIIEKNGNVMKEWLRPENVPKSKSKFEDARKNVTIKQLVQQYDQATIDEANAAIHRPLEKYVDAVPVRERPPVATNEYKWPKGGYIAKIPEKFSVTVATADIGDTSSLITPKQKQLNLFDDKGLAGENDAPILATISNAEVTEVLSDVALSGDIAK